MYLKNHFDLIERHLLCSSKLTQSASHPVHVGRARETFVRQFLRDHIGESIGIKTGEVFDSSKLVGQKANQIDVLLYDRSFPRINFGDPTLLLT